MSVSFQTPLLTTNLSLSWDVESPLHKIESPLPVVFSYPPRKMAYGTDTEELFARMEGSLLDGKLNVSGLLLTSLPPLPTTLQMLNISNTEIADIPVLPEKLWFFACANTPLTSLPRLPSGLRFLHMEGSRIETLPDLPPALQKLVCSDTPLREIRSLPPHLQYLDCIHTNIEKLPPLPETLSRLECAGALKPPTFLPKKTHSFSKSIGFI